MLAGMAKDDAPAGSRVDEAKAVLDRNWTGVSTIPAGGLYPHQWNWDTGFIAVGRSWFEQERAEAELLHLFEGQWADGRVPHIVFNPRVPADAYFPGADVWRSDEVAAAPSAVRTSGITQPPVHAATALAMLVHAEDRSRARGFLDELFPHLVAQHRYLKEHRREPGGLAWIVHPWESGLDNSPAWDEALNAIEIPGGALPPYRRRDLATSDARDRPSDRDYDRFVYLLTLYRDGGYDDARMRERSPLVVEDPMFNGIWARSAWALAEIARMTGEDGDEFAEDAKAIATALQERLWDDRASRFFPLDLVSGSHMNHHSIVSFLPLTSPDLDPKVARRAAEALRNFRHCSDPVCRLAPSYDELEGGYDRRRYWRGPVWANTNWLLAHGCDFHGHPTVARELRDTIVRFVDALGFREYYDPHGEAGYGAHDFSWTAALYLDVVLGREAGLFDRRGLSGGSS